MVIPHVGTPLKKFIIYHTAIRITIRQMHYRYHDYKVTDLGNISTGFGTTALYITTAELLPVVSRQLSLWKETNIAYIGIKDNAFSYVQWCFDFDDVDYQIAPVQKE